MPRRRARRAAPGQRLRRRSHPSAAHHDAVSSSRRAPPSPRDRLPLAARSRRVVAGSGAERVEHPQHSGVGSGCRERRRRSRAPRLRLTAGADPSRPAGDRRADGELDHLRRIDDAHGVVLAHQAVAAGGGRTGDRPRHRAERPAEGRGVPGGVERARPQPASTTTVASLAAAISRLRCEEPPFGRCRAARHLGDHAPVSAMR